MVPRINFTAEAKFRREWVRESAKAENGLGVLSSSESSMFRHPDFRGRECKRIFHDRDLPTQGHLLARSSFAGRWQDAREHMAWVADALETVLLGPEAGPESWSGQFIEFPPIGIAIRFPLSMDLIRDIDTGQGVGHDG